jgi:alpha-galactosidase
MYRIFSSLILATGLWAAASDQLNSDRILTPAPSKKPRINGATIYGAHPGHPFLYRIPTTGQRPLRFEATGLPASLKLDPATGIISGTTPPKGAYAVTLRARNALGTAVRKWKVVSGDTLALTPPMGWSTWYMAYANISDRLVREQTEAMESSGMADHGYAMINIDDGWNIKLDSEDPEIGGPARDGDGNLRPNRRFPDMKALTDYIHSKGLRAGIYIGPGRRTCGGYEASYGHEEQDAQQFARWGFDFLKYDLCSYRQEFIRNQDDPAEQQKPYAIMSAALQKLDRDFIFNFCQYGLANVWAWGQKTGANFWRIAGDVGGGGGRGQTLWHNVDLMGFGMAGTETYAGPGGWNDPDNILIGHIQWNGQLSRTPLTPDEQYTYMTLWSIATAPLVFGGDMTKIDPFTLSLLTNDEVIDINQDALGKQGYPVIKEGTTEIWYKSLEDGSVGLALFNRGVDKVKVTAPLTRLHLEGRWAVRDVWRQRDLGEFSKEYSTEVPPHGSVLLRLRRAAA